VTDKDLYNSPVETCLTSRTFRQGVPGIDDGFLLRPGARGQNRCTGGKGKERGSQKEMMAANGRISKNED
jgi:hypothetical protein